MNGVMDYSDPLSIDINGTFDVALARNQLRKISEDYNIPTVLRARAAATISTIAELVLFKSHLENPSFTLTIIFLFDGTSTGIEFQFVAPFVDDIAQHFPVAEWQLKRTCDELKIEHDGNQDLVIMQLWND